MTELIRAIYHINSLRQVQVNDLPIPFAQRILVCLYGLKKREKEEKEREKGEKKWESKTSLFFISPRADFFSCVRSGHFLDLKGKLYLE